MEINMIFGLLNLSVTGYLIAAVILTQITIASVTIFLHRSQTHQALTLHPMVNHFFRFWLWLTTGIKTKEWVAVHRKHHAKCETVDDPHSPKNWGLKTMLLQGAEVYRVGKTKETVDAYGHGTPNDWMEKNIYGRHDKLGIILMLGLDLLLFGLPGLSMWALQMIWIPFWAGGVVNGIGHTLGYRNFEPNDASTNIIPWAFFIGGEELHNNHHTFPSSAKLSVKWWEFDMGWFYIKLLQFFGLAKVKRMRPALRLQQVKSSVDFDTVKVLINNRLQIMADYSRHVIIPTLKKERRKIRFSKAIMSNQAKKLLTCSEALLDIHNKKIISEILNTNSKLNLVYQFRNSLQQIWENNKSNQQELVNSLKKWIESAQKSGDLKLEKFANTIPHYTVQ